MRMRRESVWVLLMSATVALVGASSGCARWVNYPAIGDDSAENDPNVHPVPRVVAAAVDWAIRKYPVEGSFVVNLPQGTKRRVAEDIMRGIENLNARLVSPETAGLPAYHVVNVWVRESHASVDILRPVTNVPAGSQQGGQAMNYQLITVKLVGGPLRPGWRVDAAPRAWPIGANEPPPLFGWDADWEKLPQDQPSAPETQDVGSETSGTPTAM